MDIYPKDLGHGNYARVLNNRRTIAGLRHKLTPRVASSFSPKPLTLMRKIWMYGTKTEKQTAEHATPAFDLCNSAVFQVIPTEFRWTFWKVVGIFFLVTYLWPLLILYFGILKPRMIFKEMHLKLNYDDLAALANETRDPLADDFFRLVEATIKMPKAENPQDLEKMQTAFYALGNSINLLPLLEVMTEDAVQLKAEAQSLVRQAKIETDQVVAASFQRRAEAILQRAASADHNNMIARRSQVLRDELREQIRALRASLTTTSLSTDHYAGKLADVAASIQQIAGQANSVAAAQAELESAYSAPVPIALSIAKTQVPRRTS